MTITEALAEVKLLGKRLQSKKEFVANFLWRQEVMKDPLEAKGGSPIVLSRVLQSIRDLGDRLIDIRRSIALTNAATSLDCEGVSMSIADWLTWRREVAPFQRTMLAEMRSAIDKSRREASARGLKVVGLGEAVTDNKDVRVNVDELELAKQTEALEAKLARLDGLLQVKNATTELANLPAFTDEELPDLALLNKVGG